MSKSFAVSFLRVDERIADQVVELDAPYRERVQAHQLHSYMYGEILSPPPGIVNYITGGEMTTDIPLAPSSTVLPFGDLTVFRIGEGNTPRARPANHSALTRSRRDDGADVRAPNRRRAGGLRDAAAAGRPRPAGLRAAQRAACASCASRPGRVGTVRRGGTRSTRRWLSRRVRLFFFSPFTPRSLVSLY